MKIGPSNKMHLACLLFVLALVSLLRVAHFPVLTENADSVDKVTEVVTACLP